MIMLIAANSSSAWNSAPPTLARPGASHSRMSEAGVIGYAAAKRMPPRIAPSPVISLPEASHRRALRGFGVARFRPRSRRVAASMPARRPALLASIAWRPLSANCFSTTLVRTSSLNRSRPAARPTAIMFGRPSGMALAISLIGTSAIREAARATIAGKSPPRGSLMTRLCGPTSISAPKRLAFSQSMPISRSNLSARHSTGSVARRIRAAASPPRICGPTVRLNRPCQPARVAASRSRLPAVRAPAPPLPTIASEMLSASAMFGLVHAVNCSVTIRRPRQATLDLNQLVLRRFPLSKSNRVCATSKRIARSCRNNNHNRHPETLMGNAAIRWMMTQQDAPLVPAEFNPSPQADEVVVEIAGCGVCHTDLGYYYDGVRTKHELPLTLGHEISGRVIAAGSDASAWSGRAVIVPAVIPCGICDACSRGKATICPNQKMPGNDIHGGFATHIVVPATGLCAVDESRLEAIGMELADVSVIADAVTTPYQAVMQAGVGRGDLVVINGVGGVGGYAAQIANALGGTVVAVDVNQDKLDAISRQGAALALNARQLSSRELKAAISDFAKKNALRQTEWIIFECSGTRSGQETAFSLINHGATLCVVGFTMEKVEVRLSNLMAYHARALGNCGCPPDLYPAALELVLSGRVKVAPFVEKHPLDEINRVFAAVHHGELKRRAILIPSHAGAIP